MSHRLDDMWIERVREAKKKGRVSVDLLRSAMTAAFDKAEMNHRIERILNGSEEADLNRNSTGPSKRKR